MLQDSIFIVFCLRLLKQFNKVVLPAPDGPITAKNSPGFTTPDTLVKILRLGFEPFGIVEAVMSFHEITAANFFSVRKSSICDVIYQFYLLVYDFFVNNNNFILIRLFNWFENFCNFFLLKS
jgi:hypothetical protein